MSKSKQKTKHQKHDPGQEPAATTQTALESEQSNLRITIWEHEDTLVTTTDHGTITFRKWLGFERKRLQDGLGCKPRILESKTEPHMICLSW